MLMSPAHVSGDDLFLGRSRLGRGQKPVLARNLRIILLHLIKSHEGAENNGTRHVALEEMDLSYTTPFFSRAHKAPALYGLDVWAQEKGKYGKVASLWWNDLEGAIKVVALKRGRWIARLHAFYEEELSS